MIIMMSTHGHQFDRKKCYYSNSTGKILSLLVHVCIRSIQYTCMYVRTAVHCMGFRDVTLTLEIKRPTC